METMKIVFEILRVLAFIGSFFSLYFTIKDKPRKAAIGWNATAIILWTIVILFLN